MKHKHDPLQGRIIRSRTTDLVNTSVDDMKSGLYFYGLADLDVLENGLRLVLSRGEKTKAKILRSHINKIKKQTIKI